MKKLLLSLVVAGLAGSASAHGNGNGNSMGDLLMYGSGGYSMSRATNENKFGTANKYSFDDPKYKSWSVSPGIGFYLTNNIAVGIDVRYEGTKTVYDRKTITSFPGISERRSYDLGVGPFVRYSWPIGEHFFAYGQLSAHYMRGRDTRVTSTAPVGGNSYSADDTYKGVHVGYMPAIGINVCHSVALTFSVGGLDYTYTKTDFSTQGLPAGSDVTAKNHDFQVNFAREINIGVQKTLHCGKKRHTSAEPMDETRNPDTSDDSDDDSSRSKRRRNRRNDDE